MRQSEIELYGPPMVDSDRALLMIENGYQEERIAEMNPAVVVAQRTGKATVRRGGTKKTGKGGR